MAELSNFEKKYIFGDFDATHIFPLCGRCVCLFEASRPGQQFLSHFGTASWV